MASHADRLIVHGDRFAMKDVVDYGTLVKNPVTCTHAWHRLVIGGNLPALDSPS